MTIYWKQKNGELISVDDMDINHLRNTLKMIIRANNNHIEKPKPFVLNGDMANEFNEISEMNEYPEDYHFNGYNEFY
jgi:hypothetical protein